MTSLLVNLFSLLLTFSVFCKPLSASGVVTEKRFHLFFSSLVLRTFSFSPFQCFNLYKTGKMWFVCCEMKPPNQSLDATLALRGLSFVCDFNLSFYSHQTLATKRSMKQTAPLLDKIPAS